MKPGGPVQQSYSYSVPSPRIDCLKIPALIPASPDTVESRTADESIFEF